MAGFVASEYNQSIPDVIKNAIDRLCSSIKQYSGLRVIQRANLRVQAERGASQCSIDYDLRGILLRADKAKSKEIKSFLLSKDPVRYKWLHDLAV